MVLLVVVVLLGRIQLGFGVEKIKSPSSIAFLQTRMKASTVYTPGYCEVVESSVGSIKGGIANAAGVVSIETCAQYASDKAKLNRIKSTFVSWSSKDNICSWFKECSCLQVNQCSGSPSEWSSAAISDIIKPITSSKVPLVPAGSPPSVIYHGSFEVAESSTSFAPPVELSDCRDSFSDLIRTFQSRCTITRTITYQRFIAGLVVIGVCVYCALVFVIAHILRKKELEAAK